MKDTSDDQTESPPEGGPATFTVKRATITSVSLYEISDYELYVFEQGGLSSVALNFCIFLYSIAASSATVLFTVDLSSNDRVYFSFFIVTIVGIVLGTYMLVSWWRGHRSVRDLCKEIKARMKSES